MNNNRQQLTDNFLSLCRLERANIEALAQDASFRRYFRIHDEQKSCILMDAPPEHEDVRPFITIAEHLLSLNLRAPKIIQADKRNGFILLEDFGDNTFTRLLTQNHDEYALYHLATESLVQLQNHKQATAINIPSYSKELLIKEALLLCDWYYPNQTGHEVTEQSKSAFRNCWDTIFDSLPKLSETLVLRDYHVDNLIKLSNKDCGLLDFQDAVIGSPAYDLVSLLEDARRDISENLQTAMLGYYFSHTDYDQNDFMRWYRVLGAQRHCKVLGIFTRLSVRDKKHHYLAHIDRVKRLLLSHLNQDDLQPLKSWLHANQLIDG